VPRRWALEDCELVQTGRLTVGGVLCGFFVVCFCFASRSKKKGKRKKKRGTRNRGEVRLSLVAHQSKKTRGGEKKGENEKPTTETGSHPIRKGQKKKGLLHALKRKKGVEKVPEKKDRDHGPMSVAGERKNNRQPKGPKIKLKKKSGNTTSGNWRRVRGIEKKHVPPRVRSKSESSNKEFKSKAGTRDTSRVNSTIHENWEER